ncbi:visual system homeobox 1-like [Pan paniscus]|uniref:visual system homeobox 1-like n=1 Tax=Pan paniscus TaxID=9597 RepID=UPI001560C1CC|nr:visual system homeobox 1-like [Pan paniscus]
MPGNRRDVVRKATGCRSWEGKVGGSAASCLRAGHTRRGCPGQGGIWLILPVPCALGAAPPSAQRSPPACFLEAGLPSVPRLACPPPAPRGQGKGSRSGLSGEFP